VLHARAGAGDAGGTRGGSGGGGVTWEKQGRPTRGREGGGQGEGGRVAGCRAALGRRGCCTWLAERRRRTGRETEEVGLEEEEGDYFVNSQKHKDSTVNSK
jgi:hypothetical protein